VADADVLVGRIVRPHGNKGHVVVESFTDFGGERFQPGVTLVASRDGDARMMTIDAARPYDARWVVGFEGVGSIDEAEALRGLELRIAGRDVMPLPAGSYYRHDLVGCRVVSDAGEDIGAVARVDDSGGAAPLLVVDTAGGEVLVPLAEPICRQVDGGWISGQDAATDQGIERQSCQDGDEHRQYNEGQGPLQADQCDKHQRQGQGIPGTGNEKGDYLANAGAAFIQFRPHHKNAVAAQVQQQACCRGAQNAIETIARAQNGHDEFPRYF